MIVSVPNASTEPDPDDSQSALDNAGFQAAISAPIELHGGPIGSLDAATAYERLRAAARSSSRKVVDLAREVLAAYHRPPSGSSPKADLRP